MHSVLGAAAGLTCAGAGAWGVLRNRRLFSRGERTTGTVVGLPWSPPALNPDSRFSRGTYRAVVSFHTADGQEVRISPRVGSDPTLVIGDEVLVVYDPRHPAFAAIATLAWRGTLGWLAVASAGVLLILPTLASTPMAAPF